MISGGSKYSLTDTEFEVLQLILTQGEQSIFKIREVLNDIPRAKINNAINQLINNNLVNQANNKVVATPKALSALEPYRVKRAIILAAGRGERLAPESDKLPKPMVKVHKKRLIETQFDALGSAGIEDITIVRGYKGEAFDQLLDKYPHLKFVDNPDWESTTGLFSAALAVDLLSSAYLIEGDLFISNNRVLRPYEYRSTYCGTVGAVKNDWYFTVSDSSQIQALAYGESTRVDYKFVGIMYWDTDAAEQLKIDLQKVLNEHENKYQFVESVPFHPKSGTYSIFSRRIQDGDVTEIDHIYELESLRAKKKIDQ